MYDNMRTTLESYFAGRTIKNITSFSKKRHSYPWYILVVANTNSNQPPSVAPQSGATRELVALRLERVCSVLFTPIHLQIRIDNFFGIAEFRYLYGVDTGNQSRSN